jgi:hypothetical protein
MLATITIARMGKTIICNTKYGQKNKLSFEGQDGKWYSVWENPTSAAYKPGQTLTNVEVAESEYQGKKQYMVMLPKQQGAVQQAAGPDLDELKSMVTQLMVEVLTIKKMLEAKDGKF